MQGLQNAPVTFLDIVSAVAGATTRSYIIPLRCFWCCKSHRTRLQRSWTLRLLLQGATTRSCNVPGYCFCCRRSHKTLQNARVRCFCCCRSHRNALVTLLDIVSVVAGATERSYNIRGTHTRHTNARLATALKNMDGVNRIEKRGFCRGYQNTFWDAIGKKNVWGEKGDHLYRRKRWRPKAGRGHGHGRLRPCEEGQTTVTKTRFWAIF